MLSKTDPLGRVTAYAFDTNGNITSVTRLSGTPVAITTTYTYEPEFNQLSSFTDPLNKTTTYGYDSSGNLLSVTNPLSQQTRFTYNAQGQALAVTDPLNNTTHLNYERGDMTSVTDPLGNTASRFLDGGGRILTVTNAIGQMIRFDSDPLNRLIKLTDALQGSTTFAYDADDNLLSVSDARGSVTSYAYDSVDRMQTRTDPLMHSESYGYDLSGNLNSFTDRRGKATTFLYDGLNRQVFAGFGTVTSGGASTYESTVTSTYDAAVECGCVGFSGRLRQLADSVSGNVVYTFDDFDRITSEATQQGTVSYSYDALGRRTTMSVPGQSTTVYTYDDANRLIRIAQGSLTVTMDYDAAGRPTSVTFPNGAVTQYSYDGASRITGISYVKSGNLIDSLTYKYDAIGRRIGVGGTLAQTGLPETMPSATYNAANQQSSIGSQTLTYDSNGNLINDGENAYNWDTRNRLISISGPGVNASFMYDALGRRVNKTVNGVATSFLYDGTNVVQEQTGGSPTANMLTGMRPDEVLGRSDAAGTWSLISDALGNAVALTDSAGIVQTRYSYEPFGKTAITGVANTNTAQYTRRENDGTGLYYYRARYYSPAYARFISEDPIGFGGGLDLYAYVGNDPISRKDPLGLMSMFQCVMAGIGIGGIVGLVAGGVVGIATGPLVIFVSPVGALIGSVGGAITGGIVGAALCNSPTTLTCERTAPPVKPGNDKTCNEHLIDCMNARSRFPEPRWGSAACQACHDLCVGSGTGTWPAYWDSFRWGRVSCSY
jgi:RHS repeat-associated protein